MGIRFRKSVNAGTVRVNISKSGVGCSIGAKGFRVTKKTGGGTRTTVSIPGTGISYVKDSKKRGNGMKNKIEPIVSHDLDQDPGRQPENNASVTKTELVLAWLLGAFGAHKFYRKKIGVGILYLITFGLFFIGWIGDAIWLSVQYISSKKGKTPAKANKAVSYVASVACVLALAGCSVGTDNPVVTTNKADTITTETVVAATTMPGADTTATEPTPTEAETEDVATVPTATETMAQTEPTEEMVWIPTNGGSKYHSKSTCSGMDNPKEVPLSEAVSKGFTPCKRCH